jgi:prepilin peptidase CpaA
MILDLARLLLFPALMAFAAASDLFTMTISNRVSLLLAAGFLVLALASGMGLNDILLHIGAGAVVLAVAFGCFAMGWVGGGDAKVAAAAALWFGFGQLLNYLLYASLFGGALTLLLLQFRQWPLPYPLAGQAWLLKLHAKETGIPYGIALAIGALMVYPETEWIRAVDLAHLAIR